jgi:hypothetical protein
MRDVITPEDLRIIRSHDLAQPLVRRGLAGFLKAGLRDTCGVTIRGAVLETLLDTYVEAVNIKLSEAAAIINAEPGPEPR